MGATGRTIADRAVLGDLTRSKFFLKPHKESLVLEKLLSMSFSLGLMLTACVLATACIKPDSGPSIHDNSRLPQLMTVDVGRAATDGLACVDLHLFAEPTDDALREAVLSGVCRYVDRGQTLLIQRDGHPAGYRWITTASEVYILDAAMEPQPHPGLGLYYVVSGRESPRHPTDFSPHWYLVPTRLLLR